MIESDASLVGRVRLGDAGAADTLLRRHFRAAYVVAYANVGNADDAEDVCQDAFIRCLESIDTCRDPNRFAAWLMRIVRNTAHNRRDYLRVRTVESLDGSVSFAAAHDSHAALQRKDLRQTLSHALSQLTAIRREIVLLHDLEGWGHAQIAERLDVSVAMSRRHLSDARKQLRQLLGDYTTLEPDHD